MIPFDLREEDVRLVVVGGRDGAWLPNPDHEASEVVFLLEHGYTRQRREQG